MEHMKNKKQDHHQMMVKDFLKRFWICLFFSLPVILLSKTIQNIFSLNLSFKGSEYILFICVTVIFIYGTIPFFKGFFKEIKRLQFGMMTLISLAVSIAYFYSFFVFWGILQGAVFFWEVATLIDVMLLGHFIEMKSVLSASKSVEKLVSLIPSIVHLYISKNNVKDIDLKDLKTEQKVLVKPGETIPADGIVVEGQAEVNEAFLTGESKPVKKSINNKVVGGSLNINGSLIILIKGVGKDSYLSKVIDLVKNAVESKTYTQSLADKVAGWLTIIAIFAGTLTFLVWFLAGKNLNFSLERMVTVMVITCPHALGLAVPLVIAVITTLAAKNGFLIRNRAIFERSRLVNTVVFDKTGTLTKGSFEVSKIISTSSWDENKILSVAASLELSSEHSLAKSIVNKAKKENLNLNEVENFKAIPGKGVTASIEGKPFFIGSLGGLKEIFPEIKIEDERQTEKLEQKGYSVILLANKDELLGYVLLSDVIRQESKDACLALKKMGIRLVMLTGDNKEVAENVAKSLGIDDFYARVLPEEKAERIKLLQQKGYKVAMVGDGINDAPALAQADVGIAIGAGTEIAAQTADIILVKNNPQDIVDILELSKLNYRKMVQNLAWATGYNLIAIPLAAGVLYNYKIILSPAVGALIMSLSTVIVAINAKLISFKNS